ncbi:transcriptional activator FtrA [compost metagenome]
MDIPRLAAEFPNINVLSNTRYVDEGRLITSGGISSGIHMSLHVIRRLISEEAAIDTARRMEYDITGI